MAINTTFNNNAALAQAGFNGNLCLTFQCQAANDPQFEGLSARQETAARAALSGIAGPGTKSTAFGNSPGLAQAVLTGIDINTAPPALPSNAPKYEPPQFSQG